MRLHHHLLTAAGLFLSVSACGEDAPPRASEGSDESTESSDSSSASASSSSTSTSSETSESEAGENSGENEVGTSEESSTDTQSTSETGSSEATSETGSSEATDTAADGCEGGPVMTALFLGNSYTSYNNLPALVAELACSAGYVLEVSSVTPGGYTFGSHLTNMASLDAIASQPWDVVILQNQSQLPGFNPAQVETQSLPNALALADLIYANDPQSLVLYYQTWGRISGDTQNCDSYPPLCTFEGHTQTLADGYAMYAEATGGSIAPVGFAWLDAVQDTAATFDTSTLWAGDGSHPSLHGSYLTAAVFFASLYDESPEGLTFPEGVPEADAEFLQMIAADAVLGGG